MRETIVLLVVVGWGDLGYTVGDNENCIAGTSSMLCMKASQYLFLQQLVFAYQPDNQGKRSVASRASKCLALSFQ
jgi:hypothetical protein